MPLMIPVAGSSSRPAGSLSTAGVVGLVAGGGGFGDVVEDVGAGSDTGEHGHVDARGGAGFGREDGARLDRDVDGRGARTADRELGLRPVGGAAPLAVDRLS